MTAASLIRVVVADSHSRYRGELAALIAANAAFEAIGACADGMTALELVRRERPDVLILDAALAWQTTGQTSLDTALASPDAAGLVRRLLDEQPEARVLILSLPAGNRAAAAAVRAGARGHLAKDVDPERLLESIAHVAHGAILQGEPDAPSYFYPYDEELTFLVVMRGDGSADERTALAAQPILPAADAQPVEEVRRAAEGHGGHVFLERAEMTAAIFAEPLSALRAAVQVGGVLDGRDGTGDPPWLGIHTGPAERRAGLFVGPTASQAARLARAGRGRILLSGATAAKIEAKWPPEWALVDHGLRRLPGDGRARPLFELRVDGWPEMVEPLGGVAPGNPSDRMAVEAQPAGTDAQVEAGTLSAEAAILAVVAGERASCTLSREQARRLRERRPLDLRAYRVGQVAAVLAGRDRSDSEIVRLALLVDRGEEAAEGRWQAQAERYDSLAELMEAVPDRILVLLGNPGAGKTTLLRRLELAEAIAGLRGATEGVSFRLSLDAYSTEGAERTPPEPGAWLAGRWEERYPDLPPLGTLLAQGRVLLLLDGLNEMPVRSQAERRRAVEAWRCFCVELASGPAGNRMVVSCRRLDYSQPLSSAEMRVPQVQIEPLDDAQVRGYLQGRAPLRWRAAWERLEGGADLDALRTPFYLHHFAGQIEAGFDLPEGRAALTTAFVRAALVREVEARGTWFTDLLDERDRLRLATDHWASEWDLPENGPLIGALSRLAFRMQSGWRSGEAAQVRFGLEDALAVLEDPVAETVVRAEAVVRAAAALNMLDWDVRHVQLRFVHQLVQEYFAARALARRPDATLVAVPWRAVDIRPGLSEILDALPASESLPAVATTGWEETTLLAAEMVAEPEPFVQDLMTANLALAGRAAQQPTVRSRLSAAFLEALRWDLVNRSRDPAADLRDRIACALAVGDLGDPRFERRTGPDGPYLLPPLVAVAGGVYPIGEDEPIHWEVPGASGDSAAHVPRHEVAIAPFQIGRFEVTNAEWACFQAAGGYDDERWWETEDARRWRCGELANEASKGNNRMWRQRFKDEPAMFEQLADEGRFSGADDVARWRRWMAFDDAAFEVALAAHWPPKRETESRFRQDPRLNNPLQPVVGVCWYEARAYCAWLAAQSGLAVRLPSEVEWEAAARGAAGRVYPWGDTFDRHNANILETHLRRPTPAGVFPAGDSEAGSSDMSGNLSEWTASLFGAGDYGQEKLEYTFPYDASDGREWAEAPPDVCRVARGGGWSLDRGQNRAAYRAYGLPMDRDFATGCRVAVGGRASPVDESPSRRGETK